MNDRAWLAQRFEESRPHLLAVAYRMLGSQSDADDAVQDAWLRLNRADTSGVANLGGWLTTVVSRVCLDMLRSRSSRREQPFDDDTPEPVAGREGGDDPEHEAVLADAVGLALLVVLETLAPAERLAFVLHDLFAVSFEEIAPIVERTPAAARKLASRARQRIQSASSDADADRARQREIVDAFLAASRRGDFAALLTLLDPDVVLRSDPAAVAMGSSGELRGAAAVGGYFSGRARAAQTALVDGVVGAVWALQRVPRVIFDFTIAGGTIVAIDLLADPELLREIELTILRKR